MNLNANAVRCWSIPTMYSTHEQRVIYNTMITEGDWLLTVNNVFGHKYTLDLDV